MTVGAVGSIPPLPLSKTTVADQIEFWEETFGAPTPIEPGTQIWQVKEAATALGLIGFGIFLVAFTRALLVTRAFAALGATPAQAISASTRPSAMRSRTSVMRRSCGMLSK